MQGRIAEIKIIINNAKEQDKVLTLKEIGQILQPPITSERVRQIIKKEKYKDNFCKVHKCKFDSECYFCSVTKKYKGVLCDLVTIDQISFEARRLSIKDRSKDVVIMRSLLVKKMRDTFNLSYSEIGRMLERDHTTIKNLYDLEIK
jgi:hypothetical protein